MATHVLDQAVHIATMLTANEKEVGQQDICDAWEEYVASQGNERSHPYLPLLAEPAPIQVDPSVTNTESAIETQWKLDIEPETVNRAFLLAKYFIATYFCFLPTVMDPLPPSTPTDPEALESAATVADHDDLAGDLEAKWPGKIARLYFTAQQKPLPLSGIPQGKHMPPCQTGPTTKYWAAHGKVFVEKLVELGYVYTKEENVPGRRNQKKTCVYAKDWESLTPLQHSLLLMYKDSTRTPCKR